MHSRRPGEHASFLARTTSPSIHTLGCDLPRVGTGGMPAGLSAKGAGPRQQQQADPALSGAHLLQLLSHQVCPVCITRCACCWPAQDAMMRSRRKSLHACGAGVKGSAAPRVPERTEVAREELRRRTVSPQRRTSAHRAGGEPAVRPAMHVSSVAAPSRPPKRPHLAFGTRSPLPKPDEPGAAQHFAKQYLCCVQGAYGRLLRQDVAACSGFGSGCRCSARRPASGRGAPCCCAQRGCRRTGGAATASGSRCRLHAAAAMLICNAAV